MFEQIEEEQKEERREEFRMGVVVVICLLIAIALTYAYFRMRPQAPSRVEAAGKVEPASTPDALRDLEIVKAVMGKDVSGARVLWSVRLRNKSNLFTYSDFQYEARFFSPDGRNLSGSQGTIPESIGPGEDKTLTPFVDGAFEARAAQYQFKIVAARAETR